MIGELQLPGGLQGPGRPVRAGSSTTAHTSANEPHSGADLDTHPARRHAISHSHTDQPHAWAHIHTDSRRAHSKPYPMLSVTAGADPGAYGRRDHQHAHHTVCDFRFPHCHRLDRRHQASLREGLWGHTGHLQHHHRCVLSRVQCELHDVSEDSLSVVLCHCDRGEGQ